jgi:hypothetical protein
LKGVEGVEKVRINWKFLCYSKNQAQEKRICSEDERERRCVVWDRVV